MTKTSSSTTREFRGTEGLAAPGTSCAAVARPTNGLARIAQAAGRSVRAAERPTRNLSRRALREHEQARQIIVTSDVPLTREERRKLELRTVTPFWKAQYDQRTAKAQDVIKKALGWL
jgi:superfamily II DNA or RNA helicase